MMYSKRHDSSCEAALADPLQGLFFTYVRTGDLVTAEEIAGAFIEVLKRRNTMGHDVKVPLARWQAQQALLRLILSPES